jgi:integrase
MVPTKRAKKPADKRRLTELSVRKLKPKGAPYLVWDSHRHGLAIRVQPTGRKSWNVIYSRQGRPRWLHLGDATAIDLATARLMAGEAMVAVAKGKDPAAERKAERGAGTFADLADKYLEFAKQRNRSWPQARALIERFALPRWGKLQVGAITRADIKALMRRIEAPIVANQTLAALSAMFSWGVKEEVAAHNPCTGVERNPTRSRERILSAGEIPQFWKAFDEADLITGTALKTLLLTGQRPGEVAQMRREHIRDGWWEMPGAPIAGIWPGTKNGASHRIWLPKVVQELIATPGQENGFVFAGARGRAVSDLDVVMRDICAQFGGEKATPHDLRRTHGSTITALGFGRDAMNRIQNHREGGIADVYDRHRYEAENKQIMETVAARILALVEGKVSGKVVPIRRA